MAVQGYDDFKKVVNIIEDYFNNKSKEAVDKFKEQEEGKQEIFEFLEGSNDITKPGDIKPADRTKPWDATMKQVVDADLNAKNPRMIESMFSKSSQKRINWKVLNSPNKFLEGSEVYYEVALDETHAPGNKDVTKSNFQVQIVSYEYSKQGHILGVLPNLDRIPADAAGRVELEALKTKIWDKVKEHKETSKANIVKTGIKTTIARKHEGRIWTTNKYITPKQVLEGTNRPIKLAVITTEGSIKKAVGYPEASESFLEKAQLGAVYMLVPVADGTIVPMRCFTKKIRDFNKGDKLLSNLIKKLYMNR